MAWSSSQGRNPTMRRGAVMAAKAFAAWNGTFLLIWTGCRFALDDPMVSAVMAGVGVVTLSPLLGGITRPDGTSRRRHDG